MSLYLLALAITLASEVPIVAACFPGQRWRMALLCVAATTLTHLWMHWGLSRWLSGDAWLITGEAMATCFEAATFALLSRPREPRRGLIAAALANSASYVLGLLLL